MPITMDRFSNRFRIARSGWARGCTIERRSPRNADGQASDAVAIGIDPVHSGWTVVDGCQGPTLLMIAIVSLAL